MKYTWYITGVNEENIYIYIYIYIYTHIHINVCMYVYFICNIYKHITSRKWQDSFSHNCPQLACSKIFCGTGNCGKTWPTGGPHKIKYTKTNEYFFYIIFSIPNCYNTYKMYARSQSTQHFMLYTIKCSTLSGQTWKYIILLYIK